MSRTHCSHCGGPLPRRALACPECGSDEATGWADETARHEALHGSFTDEDYEEVVRDLEPRRTRRERVILAAAILALAAFLLAYVL